MFVICDSTVAGEPLKTDLASQALYKSFESEVASEVMGEENCAADDQPPFLSGSQLYAVFDHCGKADEKVGNINPVQIDFIISAY